eukprot:2944382-Rhodomonas_salina.1
MCEHFRRRSKCKECVAKPIEVKQEEEEEKRKSADTNQPLPVDSTPSTAPSASAEDIAVGAKVAVLFRDGVWYPGAGQFPLWGVGGTLACRRTDINGSASPQSRASRAEGGRRVLAAGSKQGGKKEQEKRGKRARAR